MERGKIPEEEALRLFGDAREVSERLRLFKEDQFLLTRILKASMVCIRNNL